MRRHHSLFRFGGAALLLAGVGACADPGDHPGPTGTPTLRGALFDTIVARTERREAFSPVKNERLGFDPLAAMKSLRDEVVAADTETALYYALARLSHARRDRHLDLILVPGGLALADSAGLDVSGAPDTAPPRQAPVRISPDYSDDAPAGAYFVGDLARGAFDPGNATDDGSAEGLSIGDRITSVNGIPIAAWHDSATAFMRHSTRAALRWKLAEAMTLATASFPPHLRGDSLTLGTVAPGGGETLYRLPFVPPGDLVWNGTGEPAYPGLSLALTTATYDLLTPDDGRRFMVLIWRGFRDSMVADVDSLMAFAAESGLLDHALVMDVTRSRGGSLGAYAMQRLMSWPRSNAVTSTATTSRSSLPTPRATRTES